LGSHNLP